MVNKAGVRAPHSAAAQQSADLQAVEASLLQAMRLALQGEVGACMKPVTYRISIDQLSLLPLCVIRPPAAPIIQEGCSLS